MHRVFRLLIPLGLALLCAACGDEEATPHGLEVAPAESKPEGEPASVQYAFEDGETWRSDIYLEVQQTKPGRAGSKSSIEVKQTFHAGEAPHTTSTLRYVRVESSQGDADLPTGVTEGRFEHAPSGRPKPETRKLTGKNIALADTLYGSMMLSGLAGSPAWIPDRPIRKGEAWPAETVLTPRMVALLLQQARSSGAAIPKPIFRGTVQVDRIDRDDAGGGSVVLTIRAMVEVRGPMIQGRERGSIDMGYRVEGTATVDLRTGLPTSIDATATQRMDFKSSAQNIEQVLTLTLRAEARRVAR
ncbi:MAG: hypothetical protein QNJ98_13930 [Planctomycetota bacterium]|nr:hypothetical protein [Planctomycetota bacterium]